MKINKKDAYLITLIIIQLIVFNNWIFNDSFFTFGDIAVYTVETQKELLVNSFFVYTSNLDFGGINIASSINPLLFLFGLMANLGVDTIWSLKILILIPIVFTVIISSYLLILKLTKSRIGAFIGSLVYSYNTYFIVALTGQLYISLAYAISPFILLSFISLLEKNSFVKSIMFSLLLAVVGFIEFRILYIDFWILIFYFLFYVFIEQKYSSFTMPIIRNLIISGFIFILLNVFWLLPILMSGKLLHNEIFDRGLFGDSYFDIVSAFTVFHPWWTGKAPAIFIKQSVPFYYFLIPIVALLGLIFNSKNKNVLFFFFLFLLGVFLTKQSAEPYKLVYLWLYQNIPGFNAFREASKFYFITALSSSVLVGYSISYLWDKFRDNRSRRNFTYLLIFSISILFLLNANTVVTKDIGTMFIPREFPAEYKELNKLIDAEPNYSRILWFPATSRFSTYSNTHPAVSSLNAINGDLKQYVDPSLTGTNNFDNYLYSIFENNKFDNFLDMASVQYVIVPSNLGWDDIPSPWKNPSNYENRLDKLNYLKKINFETKNILIYENKNYKPHIYLTDDQEDVNKNIPFQNIEFSFVSPAEYQVSLKNIKEKRYLHFSEAYHTEWKIRPKDFNWFLAFAPSYFIPDDTHLKNNAGFNSFIIDPEYIKQSYPRENYHENKDGSIDIELTLYFKSQSYFYFGVIISMLTFAGCIGYLAWDWRRKRNGEG